MAITPNVPLLDTLEKAVANAVGPYDKTVWSGFPFVVNCGYDPAVNRIYIYAAFAQGGNYYPGMSDEDRVAIW